MAALAMIARRSQPSRGSPTVKPTLASHGHARDRAHNARAADGWMRLACAAFVALAVAWPAAAATLQGQVELETGGRALRSDAAQEVVVYFRPEGPVSMQDPAPTFEMRTRDKTFSPALLAIPVGASVRFPNADPILHNVFSSSRAARFDLGLYGEGEGAEHRFERAGLVTVYCNVHHSMVGHILVLDTPHFVQPDASGAFSLALPDGARGELFAWHERGRLWRQRVDDTEAPVVVRMKLRRPRLVEHMNKFGRPYGGGGEDY